MDSKSALKQLKAYQGSRKSAGDIYSQTENELGVGTARSEQENLRGLIRNTQEQLKGVGASVAGRTRGNLVTEAQRSRLQNLESQPIAELLGERQTQFGDVQGNLRDLLSQSAQRAGLQYQSEADREASLGSTYERLFQRETAAKEEAFRKRQAALEQQRWQKQFDESNRQFERQIAETRRSAAAQQAAMASLYAGQGGGGGGKSNTAREKAIKAEAERLKTNKARFDKVDTSFGAYAKPSEAKKNISTGWENVKKYGPLALFGGGSLWRF